MVTGPSIIVWTEHAFDKAQRVGWVPTDVEARLVVAYDWPADGEVAYARIVTVWRRAG